MTIVRLRIALADRSGALAQAATVIGLHGGNIRAIDVHRSRDGAAIDDLIVDFAGSAALSEMAEQVADMADDLTTNAGTTLLETEPAEADDSVTHALAATSELLDALGGDREDALGRAAARLCAAPGWWLGGPLDGQAPEAPVDSRTVPVGVAPVAVRDALGGDELEVLAVRVPDAGQTDPSPEESALVLYLARRANAAFTVTEVTRVEALLAVYRAALRIAPGSGPATSQPGPPARASSAATSSSDV